MSKMIFKLPSSYVDIDSDEMEYVDGGAGLPNWFVAGAINLGISALVGGSLWAASAFFRRLAGSYGAAAAATIFSTKLKNTLIAKGVASWIASGITGLAATGFTVLLWATDPGGQLARYADSVDCRPYNGWVDVS